MQYASEEGYLALLSRQNQIRPALQPIQQRVMGGEVKTKAKQATSSLTFWSLDTQAEKYRQTKDTLENDSSLTN